MPEARVRVHAIGNAHIDPVWRWRWQEGCAEVLHTCRAAVEHLRSHPGMFFSRGQAATYAWVEELDPDLFASIRELVREGRWEAVNGWWEQPDANVPCGESFVRHALYGKRWFREHLGVDVTVGWNVDTFGHTAGLPQILARAGFATYCFFRPGPHEKALPAPFFWWRADDGSKVLALRPPTGHYGTGGGDVAEAARDAAARARELGMEHAILFYGVGNHGGGPTRENLASLARLREDPAEPDAGPSTVAAFVEAIAPHLDALPEVRGDFQRHAPGCYTTHSGIKLWNREAEDRLLDAERWNALVAMALGGPPRAKELERAWRQVLFCQFHDVLAGTSLPAAYDDARQQLGEACAIAARVRNEALQRLAARIDTRPPRPVEEHTPVPLVNPWPQQRCEPVTVQWGWGARSGGRLVDEAGAEVPVQERHPDLFGGAVRIAFEPEIPAHGWRVCHRVAGAPLYPDDAPRTGDTWVETSRWRLAVDPDTGCVSQLLDRMHGVDALRPGAGALLVMDDPGDTWGHDIGAWRTLAGQFGDARVRVTEAGPVLATLTVESTFEASQARVDFTLYRISPRIDVRIAVRWNERHRFLKWAIPAALDEPRVAAGAAYAVLERECTGREDPFNGWLDLFGTATTEAGAPCSYGVALVAPARYGYDCLGSDLRLSLLRSPIYCFHDPAQVDPGREYSYMDQGEHVLRLALLPHPGTWRDAGIPAVAAAFGSPPEHVFQYAHAGPLGPAGPLARVTPDSVLLAALKGAEDGNAWVARLWESRGEAVEAALHLPGGRTVTTRLGAWELKTLLLRQDGGVEETSLLEDGGTADAAQL